MKAFKDNKGRTWEIVVNVPTAKRVKALLSLDLFSVIEGKLFERLAEDPALLVDVLYVLCKEQAEKHKIDEVDFGESLVGDAIETAGEALIEELISFFPPARRTTLAKIWSKAQTVDRRATEMVNQKIDQLNVDELLAKMSGTSSTSSLASAASIPAAAAAAG